MTKDEVIQHDIGVLKARGAQVIEEVIECPCEHLLNIIDLYEMTNVGGKKAVRVISKLVKILTEDPVWTLRYMKQEDALDLINCFEQFAHTGNRPKWATKYHEPDEQ